MSYNHKRKVTSSGLCNNDFCICSYRILARCVRLGSLETHQINHGNIHITSSTSILLNILGCGNRACIFFYN